MDERITSSLLYLNAVTVSFDGFRALNNLSLVVGPGEMRAIIADSQPVEDVVLANMQMIVLSSGRSTES